MGENKVIYVRDVMETRFSIIPANKTIAQAKALLSKTGNTHGVIISSDELLVGIVSVDTLSSWPDSALAMTELPLLPIFTVGADITLIETASYSAEFLFNNPRVLALVVQEKRKLVGLLTPQILYQYEDQIESLILDRGGDVLQVTGDPQSEAKYFVCPNEDYRELISLYDSENPPTCPVHQLRLVKAS